MKEYLISAALLAVMLLLGVGVNTALRQRISPTWALVTGFMLFNVLFFLPSYIFRAFDLSFRLLCIVFAVILSAAALLSLLCLIHKGNYKAYFLCVSDFYRERRGFKLALTAAVLLLFVLSFAVSLNAAPDTDDNYYMAKAMETIKRDSLGFREFVAWYGWDDPHMSTSTDASTLEALYACLSLFTGIPVTVLCKKAMILAFSPVVYSTVFNLGASLLRDRDKKLKALIFLCVYMLLSLVYRNVFDTVPYRVITTMWHGKTAVCAVVFPAILCVCMDIYCRGDEIVRSDWVMLALFVTASISLSIIGVNFTVLFCFIMAAPLIIYRLIKRQKVLQYLLPALLAMLPALIFSGISLLTVVTGNTKYFTAYTPPDMYAAFEKQFLTGSRGIVLILYILAFVYFLIKGTKEQRLILAGTTVFLAATLLNPLLRDPVAKYLTTSSVYWRLYWLIPIWYIIPAAFVSLMFSLNPGFLRGFLPGAVVTAAVCYGLFFSVGGFTEPLFPSLRTNAYALPDPTLSMADTILGDTDKELPLLLDLSNDLSVSYIRQYSIDVGLVVGSRHNQYNKRTDIIPGLNMSVYDFVLSCKQGIPVGSTKALCAALDYLNADYLVVRPSVLPASSPLTPILDLGSYKLYRVERN